VRKQEWEARRSAKLKQPRRGKSHPRYSASKLTPEERSALTLATHAYLVKAGVVRPRQVDGKLTPIHSPYDGFIKAWEMLIASMADTRKVCYPTLPKSDPSEVGSLYGRTHRLAVRVESARRHT